MVSLMIQPSANGGIPNGCAYDEPVVLTYPVRIEPGGHLEVKFASASGENEWGISAMVVRPVK